MGPRVQTDRIVSNIKPGIIIRHNIKGTCMSIDVAITADRNVIKKEVEKILNYKDLRIEIQRMWNMKAQAIIVIRGATGTISESMREYQSNLPQKHKIEELQLPAILDTAHKLREVLM
jgi:predicted Rossmann-fold nucleotide-binding protein